MNTPQSVLATRSDDSEPNICLRCIGDVALNPLLRPVAHEVSCAYCGNTDAGLAISELATEVAKPVRDAIRHGSEVPLFTRESDSVFYEQEGEELSFVLQQELHICDDAAAALAQALTDQDSDPDAEPFFSQHQKYQRAEISDWDFVEKWNEFAQDLKHRHRFFSESARNQLALILGEEGSEEAAELPALTIGTPEGPERIFRARSTTSADQARQLLLSPATEVAPPAPTIAAAGRMNPAGISVFYGAMSERVAVAEVRPSLGGLVVVAAFRPTRQLRLLDLTELGTSFTGSIFAPSYRDRAARQLFLQSFHHLVTRPVQPREEPLEYLPTQAVAEYVRNALGFDGIKYASAQTGTLDSDPWDNTDVKASTDLKALSNVVVFGEETNLASAGHPWDEDRQLAPRVSFPLEYEMGSAHGVWVTQVSYDFVKVNLDDERGFDDDTADEPPSDLERLIDDLPDLHTER